MNMDFGLFQQQSMKLAMTNELRQAIAILQYSTQELLSFMEEQQLDNPLLELKEDYSKSYDKDSVSPLDFISKKEETLQEHLLQQICYLPLKQKEKEIISYLIYSLDGNGYLSIEEAEVMKLFSINDEVLIKSIHVLQSLEPSGVGARNLKECLLLQLQKLQPRNYFAETVVDQYLEMFANKKWKEIAKIMAITLEDVQKIADVIQKLNPRPGSLYYHEPCNYIVPEISIEIVDGELSIIYNDHLLPKFSINHGLLKKASEVTETKYVQQKYQQILWLLKSIEQRQQTLIKVTEAIATYQKDFFQFGYEYLKPLTLKEIASTIGMHESTISRVTTQKYVQTPKGLFELKYFFSSSLKSDTGINASSKTVKEIIKKMIDQENKQKPLSDQKIAAILEADHSIDVSRRTVTKYREELNIPASSKRKRF